MRSRPLLPFRDGNNLLLLGHSCARSRIGKASYALHQQLELRRPIGAYYLTQPQANSHSSRGWLTHVGTTLPAAPVVTMAFLQRCSLPQGPSVVRTRKHTVVCASSNGDRSRSSHGKSFDANNKQRRRGRPACEFLTTHGSAVRLLWISKGSKKCWIAQDHCSCTCS